MVYRSKICKDYLKTLEFNLKQMTVYSVIKATIFRYFELIKRFGFITFIGTRIWGKIFGFYPIFLPLGKNWGKDFGLFTPIFALFSSFSGLLPLFLLISHKLYSIL